MRVTHLATHDTVGGAARCTYTVHRGLRAAGVDSRMLVQFKHGNDPHVDEFKPAGGVVKRLSRASYRRSWQRRFARYATTRPPGLEPFSDARSAFGESMGAYLESVDIAHINWISGFIDLTTLGNALPSRAPIVWSLHDMAPLTGGCHYDMHCGRYETRCGACPQLGSTTERDLASDIFESKRTALASWPRKRIRLVAGSRWIESAANASALLRNFDTEYIPYSVDTENFQPRNRQFSRQILGLPEAATIVLFVADSVETSRKGMDLLSEALGNQSDTSQLLCVTVGSGDVAVPGNVAHQHLGRIDDDRIMSMAYSAADVFVAPSRQEVFGLTVLESMACGVPVVAYDIGGIRDLVRPGETGLLAAQVTADALGQQISRLLSDAPLRAKMARLCRTVSLDEYQVSTQARRYAHLYEDVLNTWRRFSSR